MPSFSYASELWCRKNTPQSIREPLHRANRIIGGHVVFRVVFAGGFFQHVCGNSEPVSAV